MRTLAARAPTRIDFGGGWTDVPPYTTEEGGCVCNLAIARYASVTVTAVDTGAGGGSTELVSELTTEHDLASAAVSRLGLSGVDVVLRSDFPVGAGLGGSSAAGVAVMGALECWRGADPRMLDRSVLAEQSRAIEVEDLGVAGGFQDHYAAAYGGALGLRFGDSVCVQRIALSTDLRAELERRCRVVYTGQSRISGETITAVMDAYRARKRRVVDALARMKQLAIEMIAALDRADVDALGALVGEHWTYQRSLHAAITTPRIDAILERARDAGALGAKALGASGGGCVLVVAAEDSVEEVERAITRLAEPLPFTIDIRGFHLLEMDARPLGEAER